MTEPEFEAFMTKLDNDLQGIKPLPEIIRITARHILEAILGPIIP